MVKYEPPDTYEKERAREMPPSFPFAYVAMIPADHLASDLRK